MSTNSVLSSERMPIPRGGFFTIFQNTINPSLPRSSFCLGPNLPGVIHPYRQLAATPVLPFSQPFSPSGEFQVVNHSQGFPRATVNNSYMANVKRTFEKIFSEDNCSAEKKVKPNRDPALSDVCKRQGTVDKQGSKSEAKNSQNPPPSTIGFSSKGVKELFDQNILQRFGKPPDVPFRDPSTFKRKWRHKGSIDATKWKRGGLKFSLLCYNVLAQGLINSNSYLYKQVHPQHLSWNYRKANLMAEILCLKSDIICLQEVESDHFYNFFQPLLDKEGYKGIFKKRTGNKTDGCAIFFKNSHFQLVVSNSVSYYKRHIPLLDRDNVGIILLLQSVTAPKLKLCVATTHLLFNPRRGDIKLAQLGLFLAEIDKVSHYQEDRSFVRCPVILCGDMNSVPNSPLSEFIQKGSLDFRDIPCGDISGQKEGRRGGTRYLNRPPIPPALRINSDCQYIHAIKEREEQTSKLQESETTEKCQGESEPQKEENADEPWEEVTTKRKEQSLVVKHPFSFSSVYSLDENNREVTSNHSRTNCMVDYIFFSSTPDPQQGKSRSRLELLSSLQLFTDEEATAMGGLPNKVWSSDHFSLMASFLLR